MPSSYASPQWSREILPPALCQPPWGRNRVHPGALELADLLQQPQMRGSDWPRPLSSVHGTWIGVRLSTDRTGVHGWTHAQHLLGVNRAVGAAELAYKRTHQLAVPPPVVIRDERRRKGGRGGFLGQTFQQSSRSHRGAPGCWPGEHGSTQEGLVPH